MPEVESAGEIKTDNMLEDGSYSQKSYQIKVAGAPLRRGRELLKAQLSPVEDAVVALERADGRRGRHGPK